MDRQNRAGSKFGGGGLMSESAANADRRERLRKLALETVDLNKDPYYFVNHLGKAECKLCLTLHNNEGNYLAHTQGRKHQQNLARRVALEARNAAARPMPSPSQAAAAAAARSARKALKIGRPGYKVVKSRCLQTRKRSLLFELDYPEGAVGVQPRHRFMSSYEQKIEPPDKKYQYILFACEPYDTIGFKIANEAIDKSEGMFFTNWDAVGKKFSLRLHFDEEEEPAGKKKG